MSNWNILLCLIGFFGVWMLLEEWFPTFFMEVGFLNYFGEPVVYSGCTAAHGTESSQCKQYEYVSTWLVSSHSQRNSVVP